MLSSGRPGKSIMLRVAIAGALAVAPLGSAPASAEDDASTVRVIVELDGAAGLDAVARAAADVPQLAAWSTARQRISQLRVAQTTVIEDASERGIDLDVERQLTAAYNGFVADVYVTDLPALSALPGVTAVHRDTSFALTLHDSVPLVGAPTVWEQSDPNGEPAIGTGILVAILDSGVDYRHPDLGGGFGSGHKVVTGYDFVNDDADPMDDNGHGTHVAGIVAADGAVRGVAPGARLAAYKVTNQFGNGQLSDIIAALDAAVAPDNPYRADVVNMSLSGPGDGTDPLSQAANQAAEAGVVVVGSAGNNGPAPQTVQSPAAAARVVAVGASVSGITVPRASIVAPIRQDLRGVRRDFSANPPSTAREVDVVDIGVGTPGSYEDVDVAGKAVLIEDTGDAVVKAAAAEERGALAAFFYIPDFWRPTAGVANAVPPASRLADPALERDAFGMGGDDGRLTSIVAMQIPGASAATLQAHLAEGRVRVELMAVDATDQLAEFSSRGPTARFTSKPDLVAPGVEILSTLPDGGYGRISGTSMAAPHVAGAAALLRQLHPNWTAENVAAALTTTAHRLDEVPPLAHGAGRLDVGAAAATTVTSLPSSISFGLADTTASSIDRAASITLRNTGKEAVNADISAAAGAGLDATVTVEPSAVTLDPGEQEVVRVEIQLSTPPLDADVTGWLQIQLVGTDGPPLSVPYSLAVRHLQVHVSPDPVLENAVTSVFVRSPVQLAGEPPVEMRCGNSAPIRLTAVPAGTLLWRATAEVGEAALCSVMATGTAAAVSGEPGLSGAAQFEIVGPVDENNGVSFWQSMGPNSEGGWLAFDAANRNRMAVIPLDSPSLFLTDDRMATWREVRTMPLAAGSPVDVAVHPLDGERMYVAVNGRPADPTYSGRILATIDGGDSWRIVPGFDAAITKIALQPTGGALAVAAGGALRVTTDDGAHWTSLPSAGSLLFDLRWIGADLYAATTSGLVVIRDAAGPAPEGPQVVFRPPVLGWAGNIAGDAETILVASWPFPWLFASYDGGKTFTQVLQTTGTSFLALELVGDDVYALNATNLWIGSDRGAHWQRWGDPQAAAVEFDVGRWPAPHPSASDSLYVASRGAGLYATTEPGLFNRVGVPAALVHDVTTATGADGEALIAGTQRDTFRTVLHARDAIQPPDLEWQSSGGEGFQGVAAQFVASSPADSSVVYKIRKDFSLTFGIYRSDDGGATWVRKASPSEFPTALLVHPADPDQVFAAYTSLTGAGLVVSRDGGDTWRKIDHGRVFRALAGDPTNPDRLWAGDESGLYVSVDGGLSFTELADVPVTAIAADPADAEHLVVGGRQIFTSVDGGQTLRAADHVALDLWITDIVFGRSEVVFASTSGFYDELGVLKGGRGVLRSADGGTEWQSISRGLANLNVTSLALDRSGRYLFAGTSGGGVHRIKLSH